MRESGTGEVVPSRSILYIYICNTFFLLLSTSLAGCFGRFFRRRGLHLLINGRRTVKLLNTENPNQQLSRK